jgi:hypothetical protein
MIPFQDQGLRSKEPFCHFMYEFRFQTFVVLQVSFGGLLLEEVQQGHNSYVLRADSLACAIALAELYSALSRHLDTVGLVDLVEVHVSQLYESDGAKEKTRMLSVYRTDCEAHVASYATL